jgi:diguanylate cyclase (GGDEF)-like protein
MLSLAAVRNAPLAVTSSVALLLTGGLITFAARQQAHLRGLAETDPLTGLANHGTFHQALARELARARREGAPVSLVSIDLDDFKAINDNHGHPYGDDVLRYVASQLRRSVRRDDTTARVGGEEFALILPNTGGEVAREIADRAREAVARVVVDGNPLACSAGIAVYPNDADNASTLVQLADGALYFAKESGKDRTRRFDPERVPLAGDERQTSEIDRILERPGAIEAVFQPVIGLASGQVVGYEALARFPHSPDRPPAAWFAQAHACGKGAELEAAAIRSAFDPIGRPPGTHLAVNISPSGLSTEAVRSALPRDLTDVVVELTEHEVIVDDDDLAEALADLRQRGARIAIDDAGAGYAGLKQVMWVRPDIVKLDRGLVRGINADPARMALVESFVRFARRVGATVCAEGIESLEDTEALANLDVPWGQGFVLGRPGDAWPTVSPAATQVCRAALEHALQASPGGERSTISAGDRRLEHLSARLAGARSRADLFSALGLIAAELDAGKVCLSRWHPEEGLIETLAESGDQAGAERFNADDYPLTARALLNKESVQVLVGDPKADPAEVELALSLGYRSVLMVPVIHRGESVGLLEAFSIEERPWTRAEINRARIISNQFASVIEGSVPAPEARGLEGPNA